MANVINSFSGECRFLSNFWFAKVMLDGVVYPTVEHAYVAAKSADLGHRKAVAECKKPGDVKRLGRKVKLRPDWDSVKLGIMEDLVRQKFSSDPLRQMLLDTGDAELIEGNHWGDKFWGVCNGVGENHLGRILMKIREEIKCP